MVVQRAAKQRPVLLARFYGHGAPRIIGVSYGSRKSYAKAGFRPPDPKTTNSTLCAETLPVFAPLFRSLRTYMAKFGSIELHGCQVAAGWEGVRLLQTIADLAGVPV